MKAEIDPEKACKRRYTAHGAPPLRAAVRGGFGNDLIPTLYPIRHFRAAQSKNAMAVVRRLVRALFQTR